MNPIKFSHNINYRNFCLSQSIKLKTLFPYILWYVRLGLVINYEKMTVLLGQQKCVATDSKFKQILTVNLTASFEVNTPSCFQGQIKTPKHTTDKRL